MNLTDSQFVFDVKAPGFTLANALAMAHWSQLAYEKPTIEVYTGAAAIVMETENAYVIAFRGSRSIQDFVCDAEFPRTPTSFGGVHYGFYRDIESIMPRIYSTSVDVYSQSYKKPIVITGHSLGGALAILCARALAERNVPVLAVYTFGQPRVGDFEFAAGYDAVLADQTYRVVNQCDIVPRVPGILCGFRNVGQKYFMLSGFDFLPAHPVLKNPSLWPILLSDAFGLWNGWANKKQLALLADHPIASYLQKMASLPDYHE